MRISDWSSDVCSSDLTGGVRSDGELEAVILEAAPGALFNNAAQHWNHSFYWRCMAPNGGGAPEGALGDALNERSEERRVGKACVSKCRSRWSQNHSKKTR